MASLIVKRWRLSSSKIDSTGADLLPTWSQQRDPEGIMWEYDLQVIRIFQAISSPLMVENLKFFFTIKL